MGQAEGELPNSEVGKAKVEEQMNQEEEHTAILNEDGEIQQMLTNEDGSPIIVTGEDGTVYQVAGKNEQGQTILIAQGADGEQQCVYVASEEGEGGDGGLLTLDTAVAEAVQQLIPEQVNI